MKHALGFTLIELLIVVLIMGITAGIATVTLTHNSHKESRSVARQLMRQLQLSTTESLLKPATLRWGATPCGWQFEQFIDNPESKSTWRPVETPALKAQCLPAHVTLHLKHPRQYIIISPGGDITPFTITIGQWKITGQRNGHIEMHSTHAI